MNTILTDDERRQAIQSIVLTSPGTADQIARAVEAAVLAKLAQQGPVAWYWTLDGEFWDLAEKIDEFSPKDRGFQKYPLYLHPAPQQADRQQVPDGWKLVPVEPTRQMIDAAKADENSKEHPTYWSMYSSMLAAAPEAPAQNKHLADDERVAALCSLSYAAGMKAGWNYCVSEDNDGFERSQKSVVEAVRILKAHRATTPEAPAQEKSNG